MRPPLRGIGNVHKIVGITCVSKVALKSSYHGNISVLKIIHYSLSYFAGKIVTFSFTIPQFEPMLIGQHFQNSFKMVLSKL